MRTELWGYAPAETLSNSELIRERYQGIRPAPGYPACPDHTEKETLFALLDAETHCGVSLTESFAMVPTASVSGLYFSHPKARYFSVGTIGDDQLSSLEQGPRLQQRQFLGVCDGRRVGDRAVYRDRRDGCQFGDPRRLRDVTGPILIRQACPPTRPPPTSPRR